MPQQTVTIALIWPLAGLFAIAIVVPWALCRWSRPLRLPGLLARMALAAVLLTVLSGALFAALYAGAGADVGEAAQISPAASVAFFLRLGLISSLVWGPVLAFMTVVLGIAMERRRHERMMREG